MWEPLANSYSDDDDDDAQVYDEKQLVPLTTWHCHDHQSNP